MNVTDFNHIYRSIHTFTYQFPFTHSAGYKRAVLVRSFFTPPKKSNSDKRKSIRTGTSLTAAFRRVPSFFDNVWYAAQILDISEIGVRLITPHDVRIGAPIHVFIQFPQGNKKIKLTGRVIWKKSHSDPSGSHEDFFILGVWLLNVKHPFGKGMVFNAMADYLCRRATDEKNGVGAKPAQSLDEIESACQLLYREYVKRGYCCKEGPLSLHYNHFIVSPDSQMFIVKDSSHITGTLSLIPDTSLGLPMESIFSAEINRERKMGLRLAEVGLLALNSEDFSGKKFSMLDLDKYKTLFALFRAMLRYACSSDSGVTDLVIAVHPKHTDLYRYLSFKPIGPERTYSDGKPAIPMKMSLVFFLNRIRGKPMGAYFEKEAPINEAMHHGPYKLERYHWDEEAVRLYLVRRKKIWESLSEENRRYFVTKYPGMKNL